ncbi:MAG: hypothetical protein L6R28_01245 [Planctomycetes bacterium]|nr:hypothetical protein [Planctomycetota bacterium]
MNETLQAHVDAHFRLNVPVPLVRGLARVLTRETFWDLLPTQSVPMKRLLLRFLRTHLNEGPFASRALDAMAGLPEVRAAMLGLVAHLPQELIARFQKAVAANLAHPVAAVRQAAARTVALRLPEFHERLPALLERDGHRAIELLCMTGEAALIEPLLAFCAARGEELPPCLGFLLNPWWLSARYRRDPESALALMARFGYADEGAGEAEASLLGGGFWFVSPELAKRVQDPATAKRMAALRQVLLPLAVDPGARLEPAFRPDDPLERALFLAALRDCDAANLYVRRNQQAFALRLHANVRVLACAHAPAAFVRRRFLDEPAARARAWRLPEAELGPFLVDHARAALEIDEERRAEALGWIQAKAMALASGHAPAGLPRSPARWPVLKASDFPLARFAVLADQALPAPDPRLSPGAQGVARLAHYVGYSDVAAALIEVEARRIPGAPAIGCELQVALDPERPLQAWKQALRHLGIPSPRRPEYAGLLEASFRPCATWHALAAGIVLLRELGLLDSPVDAGLHISLGADLQRHAGAFVLPQLFIHGPAPKPRVPKAAHYRALARLYSKGLVHLGRDTEACGALPRPEVRTELRCFVCRTEGRGNEVRLRSEFRDDLASVHLLASARFAEDPALRAVFERYVLDLECLAMALPDELRALYASNFREATGDPRDPELVARLPVVRRIAEADAALRAAGLRAEAERRFAALVEAAARRAHECTAEKAGRPAGAWNGLDAVLPARLLARHLWPCERAGPAGANAHVQPEKAP